LQLPPLLAAVALSVSAPPLGLLVSGVTVKLLVLVCLSLFVAVTVCPPFPTRRSSDLYVPLEYGELVSSPPPLEKPLSAGKLSFKIPESPSVLVVETWKRPDRPACALMYTVVPLMNEFPDAPDNDTDGTDDPLVSTLTV